MIIGWKKHVGWEQAVARIQNYYEARPELRYGPAQENKAFAVLDELCSNGTTQRDMLTSAHGISNDGVLTILSNVTMALQGKEAVVPPEDGGWYVSLADPRRYVVSPGFGAAWLGID